MNSTAINALSGAALLMTSDAGRLRATMTAVEGNMGAVGPDQVTPLGVDANMMADTVKVSAGIHGKGFEIADYRTIALDEAFITTCIVASTNPLMGEFAMVGIIGNLMGAILRGLDNAEETAIAIMNCMDVVTRMMRGAGLTTLVTTTPTAQPVSPRIRTALADLIQAYLADPSIDKATQTVTSVVIAFSVIHTIIKIRSNANREKDIGTRVTALSRIGDIAPPPNPGRVWTAGRGIEILKHIYNTYPQTRAGLILRFCIDAPGNTKHATLGEYGRYVIQLAQYANMMLVYAIVTEVIPLIPEIQHVPRLASEMKILNSILMSTAKPEVFPFAGVIGSGAGMHVKGEKLAFLGSLGMALMQINQRTVSEHALSGFSDRMLQFANMLIAYKTSEAYISQPAKRVVGTLMLTEFFCTMCITNNEKKSLFAQKTAVQGGKQGVISIVPSAI